MNKTIDQSYLPPCKLSLWSSLLLLCLLGSSCQRSLWNKQTKGLQAYTEEEFWYELITSKPDQHKASLNEQVRIDYTVQKGKQVLAKSYGDNYPVLVEIPEARYDNFFTKALKLMGEGDSLRLLIPAEEIPEMLGEYAAYFGRNDLATFTFRMYEIKDAETARRSIRQEQQELDSIRQTIPTMMQEFEQGTLADLNEMPSGLSYIIFDPGRGTRAEVGDAVTVHYICYSDAGLIVDDSYTNMVPLPLVVGSQALIEGISEGVALLREGGKAILFVPPHLGYGAQGYGEQIPPNSWVTFYIELRTVEKN